MPKVFISYSHDSEKHKQRVAALVSRLRGDAISVVWDNDIASLGGPDEGWPRWCERQIVECEFVLACCTEAYRERFNGDQPADAGLGVAWEAHLIRQYLYKSGTVNRKLRVLLFEEADLPHIPQLLQTYHTFCPANDESYAQLLAWVTGTPRHVDPPFHAVEYFTTEIKNMGLLRCLQDVGLSELPALWLATATGVKLLYARSFIKALALLSDKSGERAGKILLSCLRQSQLYNTIEARLSDLAKYIIYELRGREEVTQVLSGQRSIRVRPDLAEYATRDLRTLITMLVNSDTIRESEFTIKQIEGLAVQPRLEMTVEEEEQIFGKAIKGLNRFAYGVQKTAFLGRATDLQQLEDFLSGPQTFCWWLMTGQGGLGKSRLALELCLRNGNVWRAGFLPAISNGEDWRNEDWLPDAWLPTQPTLIIADYAASRSTAIGNIIRQIKDREDFFRYPVRLLLLERKARKYYDGESYDVEPTEEEWFRNVKGRRREEWRKTLLVWYNTSCKELGILDSDSTWKIIRTFANERAIEIERDERLNQLKAIDNLCRPLYASLLGDAIGGGRGYRQWDAITIIGYVLEREKQEFWRAAGVTEQEKDVLALTTIMGGVGIETDFLPEPLRSLNTVEEFSLDRYRLMASGSTGTFLRPLEPDIIGEMYVLDHLSDKNPRRDQIAELAWVRVGVSMQPFYLRTLNDFPRHPTLQYLLRQLSAVSARSEIAAETRAKLRNSLYDLGHLELAKELDRVK